MLRWYAGDARLYDVPQPPFFVANRDETAPNESPLDTQSRRNLFPGSGGIMASTRRRKLKKLRMKKANHGKRPLAGK